MRALHVIPSIGDEASGPSQSVPGLCRALAQLGVEVELHALRLGRPPTADGYQLELHPVLPSWKLGASPAMRAALTEAAHAADVLHSHSLWMLPNIYPGRAAARAGKPLVISPRGTLASPALARHAMMKRILWSTLQGPVVRRAACLHVTSEDELRDVRRFGLTNAVAVIPNGVDLSGIAPRPEREARRVMLFLGRVHPIKGIDVLLRAWSRLEGTFPQWDLRIVGPGRDEQARLLRELASTLALRRVEFVGARFGPQKWAEYAKADLYVLPSRTENFGMTVAEALGAGLPVIVTRGAPWPGIESHGCGRWINLDVDEVTQAAAGLMSLGDDERASMGARGQRWMREEFGWEAVARRMLSTYQWLRGSAPRPAFVDS